MIFIVIRMNSKLIRIINVKIPLKFIRNSLCSKSDNLLNNSNNEEQPKAAKTKTVKTETKPVDISNLDLRVGKILKCEKHPVSTNLFVEEVDLGDGTTRTVCSGLVGRIDVEQLQNQLAIFLCNLKTTKFKGVPSQAMLLCASTTEKMELLVPPSTAVIGDKVTVHGYENTNNEFKEINKKNKIFDIVKVDFTTNDDCVACYKTKPLEIIGKGVIKCTTLKNAQIS